MNEPIKLFHTNNRFVPIFENPTRESRMNSPKVRQIVLMLANCNKTSRAEMLSDSEARISQPEALGNMNLQDFAPFKINDKYMDHFQRPTKYPDCSQFKNDLSKLYPIIEAGSGTVSNETNNFDEIVPSAPSLAELEDNLNQECQLSVIAEYIKPAPSAIIMLDVSENINTILRANMHRLTKDQLLYPFSVSHYPISPIIFFEKKLMHA